MIIFLSGNTPQIGDRSIILEKIHGLESITSLHSISSLYLSTRKQTQFLCDPLEVEDFVVQPVTNVSPLKWHLGHTTWFFETFILVPHLKRYKSFNPKYSYLFNSYYIEVGDRWSRENRGQLTRPTVQEVFEYKLYVDEAMGQLFEQVNLTKELFDLIEIGCNHEQQHQELFLYDVKRILGNNPLLPIYRISRKPSPKAFKNPNWLQVDEGIYEIGCAEEGFHFDNERGRHKIFLHNFEIGSKLVTNGEYLEFIESGGYSDHSLWLSEAWDWLDRNDIKAPQYWHQEGRGEWKNYTLGGLSLINWDSPVAHVSYFEADAFARWKGCRLPTEFEWEVACGLYNLSVPKESNFVENGYFEPVVTCTNDFFGNLWEWTSSPYTAYPYFSVPDGAMGEYNGKFMINQMVLRGGSFATPRNHIRKTYRNFFHPHLRWLFSGIRLARYTH